MVSEPPASGAPASGSSSTISRLRRGTAVVFLGSVLGYGINYLATPLLGRLVTPETFGLFSATLALASLFTGVSTMRLEVFAASVDSSPRARAEIEEMRWVSTRDLERIAALEESDCAPWAPLLVRVAREHLA